LEIPEGNCEPLDILEVGLKDENNNIKDETPSTMLEIVEHILGTRQIGELVDVCNRIEG